MTRRKKPLSLALPLLLSSLCFWAAPPSAVAVEEIVCVTCHSALPGRLAEPVRLWKQSVHAASGITCNLCHGGDAKDAANAMSRLRGFLGAPKEQEIPAFCGRCHEGVMRDFLRSAHGKAMGKGGPTCVTCHGNHLVIPASLDIINEKNCGRCHDFRRGQRIRETMMATENHFLAIRDRIDHYKVNGTDAENLEKKLFDVRFRFHALSHELDGNRIADGTGAVKTELRSIDENLDALDDEFSRRKSVGAIVVCFSLVAALLFYLLKKKFDQEP